MVVKLRLKIWFFLLLTFNSISLKKLSKYAELKGSSCSEISLTFLTGCPPRLGLDSLPGHYRLSKAVHCFAQELKLWACTFLIWIVTSLHVTSFHWPWVCPLQQYRVGLIHLPLNSTSRMSSLGKYPVSLEWPLKNISSVFSDYTEFILYMLSGLFFML